MKKNNFSLKSLLSLCTIVPGEVSDSGEDSSNENQFNDGYDDNLYGDEEDRKRLEMMTEKEREQELFDRMERRNLLRTRSVILCDK